MQKTVRINNRSIGPGHPAYVIAELSGNHNQDYETAVKLVHAAKEAGADAVKLQTYTAETMTLDSQKPEFHIVEKEFWGAETLFEFYAKASTPWEWQPKLKKLANDLGMDLFSTPFDDTAVDFLRDMDVPAYKIASFELVDIPLIQKAAAQGKPMILSTGMAAMEEIKEAIDAVYQAGNDQVILLKCTSAYPTPPSDAHLSTIPDMMQRFDVPVGLSDHTLGIAIPITAVALGACVVEKHFCLSRNEPGSDAAFSLEPAEFKEMVDAIRAAEAAIGKPSYGMLDIEEVCSRARRSLFAAKDIKAGEVFTEENVRSIRPAGGLPPKELPNILGKKASRDIEKATPLLWDAVYSEE